MMTQIIDGKSTAQQIRLELKQQIAAMPTAPQLDIVLVGNDDASEIYVRNKLKAAAEIGLKANLHRLAEQSSEAEILTLIERLNNDSAVNGIIVQLPLPAHINTHKISKHTTDLRIGI
jgi:methylenetetrahydrofolate dehydrogenase (NADP+)/methenyltetrahydrofolate cyclohydrolase